MPNTKYLISRKPVSDYRADREFVVDDGHRFTWTTNSDEATDFGRIASFRTVRLLNTERERGGHFQYSVWAVGEADNA